MDKKNYRFSMVATDSGKTRISCSRCRKKNMVCDKLVPSCTNCMKRGLNCSYPLRKQWTRRETKELERKEKESKKRQKRLETSHSTKKKKLSRGGSSEYEDVSSSLSSLHKDPLFDSTLPNRSASETELSHPEPMMAYPRPIFPPHPHSSPKSSSPFQSSPLSNRPQNTPSTSSPLSSPMGSGTQGGSLQPPIRSPTGDFRPDSFGRSLSLASGTSGLSQIRDNMSPSPLTSPLTSPSPTNLASTSSPTPSPTSIFTPTIRDISTQTQANSELRRDMSTDDPRTDPLRPGGRGFTSSFGFSRAPNPRSIPGSLGGSAPLSGGGGGGLGVGGFPPPNSLPGLKEVFQADNSRLSSEDRTSDSSPFSDCNTLSNPFSSPVSPSSPFGIQNRPSTTHQVPLSPLSSLTISTPSQPPRSFMLSSMMNATFPPPSTVSPSLSMSNTPTNGPSLLSQLPPLLPSNSFSSLSSISTASPHHPPSTVSPGVARSGNLHPGSPLAPNLSPMGFIPSSSTPPFLPRHSSADTLNAEGCLASPPETPSPRSSQSSWSSSAPLFPASTSPTSPTQSEEEVITAQEHAFFEEMGWLTLSKDSVPSQETKQSAPTTAVVRSSLSDRAYQTKLVENSTSPMVSMYFGAYRAPSGDIRVRHPKFAAKNDLAQKEFRLSTTKSLKGQYHPVSQRRVFEEMRSRYIAAPDQVVQEVRFGVLIDDRRGNWIEYATCANYFYGVDGLLTYVTRSFVKCTPSLNAPSIDYLMGKELAQKKEEET